MKLREDSPFKNITKEQIDDIWEMLEAGDSMEVIADTLGYGENLIGCSIPALRRFVRRLKEDALLEEAEEGFDVMEKFAERAKDSKSMDATLEATRQRLFEEALETNDRAGLLVMFKALNEEKAQSRMLAVEERKAKVAEENAKLGWRKLELSAAQSALKLLPQIREALMDASVSAEERVNRALGCLMEGGGKLLLGEGAKS